MALCTSATIADGVVILMTSRNMSKEMTAEKQEYIEKLMDISQERAVYVGIDHAALDISGYALKATEERLETMKNAKKASTSSATASAPLSSRRMASSPMRKNCSFSSPIPTSRQS